MCRCELMKEDELIEETVCGLPKQVVIAATIVFFEQAHNCHIALKKNLGMVFKCKT